MTEEVIRLEDVWVNYNHTAVLEGVSMVVEPRDFLGVIGPNGGGKTTLLKVVLGLIKPQRGTVRVLGKPPGKSHSGIGYIPQKALFDRQFPISVEEAALMGRYSQVGLFRRYSAEDRKIVSEALQTVGMLEYRGRQIGQLSGGQQQRVFIARALASSPKLLLLDEPTESVDPAMQAEFYELLQKLRQHMAIVLVSHDISAISIYVDKIACLNHQLAYHGSKDISPETLERTYQCPIRLIAHGPLH